jgi:hypothetical protein
LFQIVALPYAALQDLPPLEFKLMAAVLRYANKAGECWPALRQLAADIGKSEATVCRAMRRLAQEFHCFAERTRPGNGRYRYKIAERFLPRWPGKQPPKSSSCSIVQDGLAQPARQEANPPKQAREARERARFAKPRLSYGEIPDERARWEPRLRSWRQSKFWLPLWGPKPDEAGCFAPVSLMT